ncbi:MAG: endolytic transglycosylase MltG [Ilumatobacteraceae bacterium]
MSLIDEREWHTDPWDASADAELVVSERRRSRAVAPVRWAVWLMLAAAVIGTGVFGGIGLWYTEKINPPGDPGAAVTFTVGEDDTLETVSERLAEAGLISEPWVFRWYVDRKGGLPLTPGYYQLRPDDHMGNVMRILSTPPSETFTNVTFPEGFSVEQMARRLGDRVPRLTAVSFGNAATDGSVRSLLQPEGIDSLEGLLFPDTYQVSNGESVRQVIQRMVSLMERVAAQEDLAAGAARLGLTPYQVLIVASLIEREARVAEDRPKIARVIYNRLQMGMLLQIDASLFYQQDPSLSFSQLKEIESPYNTYLVPGLPPTPIANPGRASIQAALNPAANPSLGDPLCVDLPSGTPCVYLYYVLADEDGRHVFAATLEQHEVNVQIARDKGLL